MASWHRVGTYESAALKEAKAESARKKLQKKNPNIRPVILQGRAIAQRWWGKAWCQNLERYAEYARHMDQGRQYVRYGTVLDLQITPGQIAALVQGSREKPYKVQVHLDRIGSGDWRQLRQACEGRIDSLPALLAGDFPKAVAERLTRQGQGLLPVPEEIHFECTCPEGDGLCKHVMAVLYGVGARLDEAPAQLFLLRQVNAEELIRPIATEAQQTLEAPVEGTAKGALESKRRLAKALGKQPAGDKGKMSAPPAVNARRRRIVVSPAAQAAVPDPPGKGQKAQAPVREKSTSSAAAEKIVALIRQSTHGIDADTLQRHTGLAVTVIRTAVYAALRKGLIRRVGWGLYKGA